jgi:hypothetical protein
VDVGEGTLGLDDATVAGSPTFTGAGSLVLVGNGKGLTGFTASGLSSLRLEGTGGNLVLPSSSTLSGIPNLQLGGITLPAAMGTLPGVQTLTVDGVLSVGSTLSLTGVTTFSDSGTLAGGGTVTLPSGTTSTLVTNVLLTGGTRLVNQSTTTTVYGESNALESGSTLENAGTLTMTDNSFIEDGGGTGTNSLINEAGATITYTGSTASSGAAIEVSLQDRGAVDVGEGTLGLPTYAPAAASTLSVNLSGTPGQVSVSGAAALKGTLAISTQSGYLPKVGTKVTILTASSRKGTFSTVTGTQLSGEHWVVSYTSTSVVLTMASG